MNIFTESINKTSWSRITGTVIVVSQLIAFNIALFKNSLIVDIPTNWMTLVLFLYGINKVSSVFQNKPQDNSSKSIKLNESN